MPARLWFSQEAPRTLPPHAMDGKTLQGVEWGQTLTIDFFVGSVFRHAGFPAWLSRFSSAEQAHLSNVNV